MHIYISCYDGAARLIIFNSVSLDTSTWKKPLFSSLSTTFDLISFQLPSSLQVFISYHIKSCLTFFYWERDSSTFIAFVFIFIVEFFVVCWENFRLFLSYCRVFQFQSIGKFIVYWRKWARRTRKEEEDKEEVNFQLKENILGDDRLIY